MLGWSVGVSKSSSNGNHIRFSAPENVTMSRIKNWEELALKGSHFAQKRGRRKRPRKAEKSREKPKKRGRGQKRRKAKKKKAKKKKEKKSYKTVAPVDKQALWKKRQQSSFGETFEKKRKKKGEGLGFCQTLLLRFHCIFILKNFKRFSAPRSGRDRFAIFGSFGGLDGFVSDRLSVGFAPIVI